MPFKRNPGNWRTPKGTWNQVISRGIFLLIIFSSCSECQLKFQGKRIQKHVPEPLIGMTLQDQRETPLYYDTFFPVIFEIETPNWNGSNLKLEIPKNLTGAYGEPADSNKHICNEPKPSSSLHNTTSINADLWEVTLCPIKRKFDQMLEGFIREMKVFETFNASITKLDSHFSSCHEIKPHFSNHIIDELEIELYLVQIILDCPIADVIHHKINVSTPNKAKYAELFQLFLETYILPRFRLIGFPKFAIPTNTLLTLHTTHLLNYLLDSFQWTSSINTCNSQRIPRLLVSQETMRTTLEEIEEKIAKEDLRLTIPISDLSNYYKLKLADCVLTTTNNYIIRVLVPLTRISASYKLVSVKSVPFLSRDTTSSKTMICHHKNVEGNYIVEGKTSKPVDLNTCGEAELCRVPPEGERDLFPRCVYATLLNDTVKMLQYCRMTCVPYDSIHLPYIKRIRSDQFVIAGRSSAEIAVICKKEEEKPIPVEDIPNDIGSLIITIPCSCHLAHRSVKYEINGPCEFNLDIRPVLPKGYSYDTLLEHYFHHHLQNISDAIASSLINQSQVLLDDSEDGAENSNNGGKPESSNIPTYPVWPIYLAYVFLLAAGVCMVFAFFVLRNVYIRVGLLEMSAAKTDSRGTSGYLSGPEYSRNASVAFSVRGEGTSNPGYLSNEYEIAY